MISRRSVLALAAVAALGRAGPVRADALPLITVTKDPNCGCCSAWADHLKTAGFPVEIVTSGDMQGVKDRLGVPGPLASCHTAEVAGYVVEGHVPAAAIIRLLGEKPAARGLAVPGMPVGSPGMAVAGVDAEIFDVMLFGAGAPAVFARFKGDRPA